MLSPSLVTSAALIVLLLGALHLAHTFFSRNFDPRDGGELKALMQKTSPRITSQTSMWRGQVGFHASHSLGAVLFGIVYIDLALAHPGVLFGSWVLAGVGSAYLLAMVALARRYWFRVPLIGLGLSAALYLAGVVTGWP